MSKFTPSIRKAPTDTIANIPNSGVNALVGKSVLEVITDCQWAITSGTGKSRAKTGATFLNAVTPRLFAANPEMSELYPLQQMYANFDNLEDSVAVGLANYLSTKLIEEGEMPDLQYYFKLIDAKTKLTIATDMPERAERTEVASDLPDYLRPATAVAAPYVPREGICAFLHIYAEQEGRPVRIASRDIEDRFSGQVAVVANCVAKNLHIQAGVTPQDKVTNWLEGRETVQAIEASAFNPNEFSAVAES